MRLHRFYVNKPLGEELVVENVHGSGEEKEILHQWAHVFRFKSGDEVFLFSETSPGTDFLYRITTLSKERATLTPLSTQPTILPPGKTALVMALVKKDTFETIVRQATELGIQEIIPLLAARSEKKNLNFERLRAISIEASEQCGRGSIPKIHPIASFEEAWEVAKNGTHIVGSLSGTTTKPEMKEGNVLWVGPEGGWTEEEEEWMRNKHFLFYKLNDTVLRADTAAIALLSAIQS